MTGKPLYAVKASQKQRFRFKVFLAIALATAAGIVPPKGRVGGKQ
jgi:hypothetical protein